MCKATASVTLVAAALAALAAAAAAQALRDDYDSHVRLRFVPGDEVDLYWTVRDANASFALRGRQRASRGYVAFALHDSAAMVGAHAYMAYAGGAPSVREYLLNSKSVSPFVEATGLALDDASVETDADGALVARFTRALSDPDGYTIDPAAGARVAYALGPSSGELRQHASRGDFVALPLDRACTPKCEDFEVCGADGGCACPDGLTGAACNESAPLAGFADAATLAAEYDASYDLAGGFTLFWSVREADGEVDFAVRGEGTGYFALGFNPSQSMAGTRAFICTAAGSAASVGEYAVTSRSAAFLSGVRHAVEAVSGGESDGVSVVRFTRAIDASDFALPYNSSAGAVWARGSTDAVQKHTSRGFSRLNLAEGSGESVSESGAVTFHAVMMTLGLGVLLPVGVWVARYGRAADGSAGWFAWHRGLQVGGLVATLVGFFVILAHADDVGADHFGHTHGAIGLVVVILATLQACGGFARASKGASWRGAWEAGHRFGGAAIILLGIVNVFLGLDHHGSPSGLVVVWALWVAAYVALLVYGEVRKRLSGPAAGSTVLGVEEPVQLADDAAAPRPRPPTSAKPKDQPKRAAPASTAV